MLRIRTAQIEVFERADAPHFEPRTIRHLQEAFPKHCGFLGEDGVREVVRYGVKQAQVYGLTHQSEVSLFIDLTLLLGRFFHADMQLPWASRILNDDTFPDQLQKAQRLHAEAMAYLDQVSGPDNEYIDAAQRRLLHEKIAIETGSVERFEQAVLPRLDDIWPEKYRYLGTANVRQLLRQGISAARSYGLKTEPGVLVYVGLMYMLGSGFDKDPLFPWAGEILSDKQKQPQAARTEKLYSAAMDYLRKWCA